MIHCFSAKQRGEFLEWISPLDFHATQTTTFGRHTIGTGTWLLQDSQFLEWLQGNMKLLWCRGDPGVGKTILASVIIDHLQRLVMTPEDVVIYIYCEYNRKAEQTSMQLLGSILKQLVERRPVISQHLLSLYRTHSSCKTIPTFPELMDALRTELQSYTRACLIVDALDECSDEARNLFLSKESPAGLRSFADQLLMTSRNMPSIAHALKLQSESTIHIQAHVEDLQTYIQGCLVGVKRLNRLVKENRSLQDNIIKVVISKAAGMFLQAKLHLDSLAKQTNVNALRKALEGLPEDIWRSYDNAMLRIDAQGETDSKLAYHIFYWLSCSKKPLTVLELQHAVAVSLDPEMTDMDPEAIVDIETLTDVCAGLIITDESFTRSQLTVRLVHYTMQEYLQINQQKLFPDIQSVMATTCLTYMSFNVFNTWNHSRLDRLSSSTQYPLYKYAALFWGKHACHNQEEIFPHVQRFLQKPANVACASQVFIEGQFHLFRHHHLQLSSHALYLPTVFSLVKVLGKLVPDHSLRPADVTLLHLATLLEHAETVMVLLTKLDPSTQDKNHRTALSYSAEWGWLKIVRLLLRLQVIQPDLPDKNGCTPFIHACHHGHVEIVQLFLDRHDVNHNLRDYNGWTALFHAVDQKHVDVAQILLQHGDIQPDISDNTGKTPLIWAAQKSPPSKKYSELMRLLLEREDVNPDSQDEHFRTALSYNAGGMCYGMWDRWIFHDQATDLLEKGATADLQDKYLRTPLSYAIEGHQSRIIKLLLENNAVDCYSPNLYLHTPISYDPSIINWSPRVDRLLTEFSELKVNLTHVISVLNSDNIYMH
ncbi:ankyrin repeat-containing domain protein [Mycena floridula]|nr:ankyrin repeat-containing domain protein [Mycena floridula]